MAKLDIDLTKPDYIKSVSDLNAENNPQKFGFNTIKTELENYLHQDAIKECYAENGIVINLTNILDNDDVPEKVAIAVHEATSSSDWYNMHTDPLKLAEKQSSKISRAKKMLNTKAIEKMTIERLKERGGYDEIRLWLEKIKSYI